MTVTSPSPRRRRARAVPLLLVALLVVGVVLAVFGGSDDDGGDEVDIDEPVSSVTAPTTAPADSGGIEVDAPEGTNPITVPAADFGIAVPQEWEAVVLTDDALARIDDADLVNEFFLDAARQTMEAGAIFYAAGIDTQGRVSELKIDRVDGVPADEAAVQAQAQAVVDADGFDEAVIRTGDPGGDEDRPVVVIDYVADATSADDGSPIEVHGSQVFVGDGDRIWSLVVTSEDEVTRDLLVTLFIDTFTTGS